MVLYHHQTFINESCCPQSDARYCVGVEKSLLNVRSLLSSLRDTKRYVVYHVASPTPVSAQATQEAVRDACQALLGNYGMAKANVSFLEDWQNQKGILRVNRAYVDYIKSAFLFIRTIAGHPASVSSVTVSGILARARTEL